MYARLPPTGRRLAIISVIHAVGFDLVDVARFARVSARHDPRFAEGLFSPAELEWCSRRRRRDEHLAARFAAREAALKALGTGLAGRMSWKDIEVLPGEAAGVFGIVLRGAVGEEAARQGVRRVHLAIATTRDLAAATVIMET